ncbi:unnamed protein product [Clonostachys chloroleuca]|uniref:Uncharacterized protein n=1 Tax=Clonostachys chloroleuca TaxID=1926264 RepID=A0AA35M1H3_9HYPO|nr:unnamed protein product [Clonostachys chloroleuca]
MSVLALPLDGFVLLEQLDPEPFLHLEGIFHLTHRPVRPPRHQLPVLVRALRPKLAHDIDVAKHVEAEGLRADVVDVAGPDADAALARVVGQARLLGAADGMDLDAIQDERWEFAAEELLPRV